MHIHTIKFGKHIKRLLRVSYREGRVVRKHTITNLTRWHDDDLSALSQALAFRRECRDASLKEQADRQIYGTLLERIPPWQLFGRPVGCFRAR
jgi:hypothetical protein